MSTGPSMGGMNAGSGGGDCGADLSNDVDHCGKCGRACLVDEQVKAPRCVDGVCQSFCKSGFVNIELPETGPDDGCESPGRRVFVTEGATTADELGGVAQADERCQMLADSLELGGKWSAWLSEENEATSVAQRFTKEPDAPYMLLDFTVIADSWTQLTSNLALLHPIDLTENETPPSQPVLAVWTGTTPAGLPSGSHCGGWTDAQGEGTAGDLSAITEAWTENELPIACSQTARLYCFEQ